MAATGYGPTQLDKLIGEGKLPTPIPLSEGGRAIGWFEDEIIAHQEARAAERDRDRGSHKIKEHSPHQGRSPTLN
jgi:predicted DNA-binding transcriptional regulator AlpA